MSINIRSKDERLLIRKVRPEDFWEKIQLGLLCVVAYSVDPSITIGKVRRMLLDGRLTLFLVERRGEYQGFIMVQLAEQIAVIGYAYAIKDAVGFQGALAALTDWLHFELEYPSVVALSMRRGMPRYLERLGWRQASDGVYLHEAEVN